MQLTFNVLNGRRNQDKSEISRKYGIISPVNLLNRTDDGLSP